MITATAVLIFFSFLSGYTQVNTVNNNVSNEIELVCYNITTDPSNSVKEVNGAIRKIGNAIIDHSIVGVYFYNKQNNVIFYSNYSVYSFVKCYEYPWFVEYRSTDPHYEEYDHYSIVLDYV